jgi:hypothetical protein
VVAFYEVEVWILHFFKLVGVGLAAHRPPAEGTPPGGSESALETGNARRINELPTLYPHSGQLYIMGIIRTDSDNPLRIKHLRVV